MSEQLARKFHETYERLAPEFGYETRKETKDFDPDSANGRLMIAVCKEIADEAEARARIAGQEKAELVELLSAARNYIDSFGYALARSKADRDDATDIRNSMNSMLLRLDRAIAKHKQENQDDE